MWGSPQEPDVVAGLGPLRKINHFPGTYQLVNIRRLTLQRMRL